MAQTRRLPSEPTPPAKLAHFVLRTRDKEKTRDWYANVLGAHVVFENPLLCFMTYDDEHHRIALVQLPECPEQRPGQQGLEHVAFGYASLGELLGTYRRLEQDGIEPYWCINHGPTTSMYYRDPEGNQIELQIDNFEKVEELQAWFTSGAFAENPIGVPFDPERLIARYERGDPIDELIQQHSAD